MKNDHVISNPVKDSEGNTQGQNGQRWRRGDGRQGSLIQIEGPLWWETFEQNSDQ